MIRQCAILFGCLALGELVVFLTDIKLPSTVALGASASFVYSTVQLFLMTSAQLAGVPLLYSK